MMFACLNPHSPCTSVYGLEQHPSPRTTASSTIRPRPPPYKPPTNKASTLPRLDIQNHHQVDRVV